MSRAFDPCSSTFSSLIAYHINIRDEAKGGESNKIAPALTRKSPLATSAQPSIHFMLVLTWYRVNRSQYTSDFFA
jgi:hypothetical protein